MKNTEHDAKSKLKEFVEKVENNTNDALEDSLMDDDAKEENFDIDYTDIVKNSTKAKMSKLPWLISIFLILIIALILCLMFFKNNPKTLFTQTVDGLFSYLEDNINENVYDVMDGNVSLDYTIKSSEDSEFYNNLSGISWSADYVKDNSSSQVYADIKATSADGVIPIIIYGNGSNTYVSLSSLSDKFIKLNSNPLSYFVSGNDVRTVLDGINQAIDKAVADEKIYGGTENVDIDGDVLKTYKMRLVIDSKNRDRVVETFVNTLKANDELTSVLARMRNVSEVDIRKSIENYLPKLKSELERHDKLEVSLYIDNKTNEFIKMDMASSLGNINLTSKGDNKYTYSIFMNDDSSLSTGEFSFSVNDSKTKYTVNVYYKKTKDNNVLTESNFDIKYTSKRAGNFKESEVIDNIENNEMTELEKFDFYSKVLTDPNFSKFLPIFEKMV